MVSKQHLNPIGFNVVLSYYAKINRGVSPKVLLAFPERKSTGLNVDKVTVDLPENLHPEWVSGFVAGAQQSSRWGIFNRNPIKHRTNLL